MPQQEVFFEQSKDERLIRVLKTYDQKFAREAFEDMDENAQTHLRTSLQIGTTYDPGEIASIRETDGDDFLWDELLEAAREDGSLLSFFVVNEARGNISENLYVSPDWPSAEIFAKNRITGLL